MRFNLSDIEPFLDDLEPFELLTISFATSRIGTYTGFRYGEYRKVHVMSLKHGLE